MILPYWNTDLDLEIASWFPLGLDYHPVSSHQFAGPQVQRISELCLAAGSEFLFMSSLRSGCVGSLVRDSFYKDEPALPPLLGMIMILGYSPEMERLVVDTINEPDCAYDGEHDANAFTQATPSDGDATGTGWPLVAEQSLAAGVAFCSLWRRPFGRHLYGHVPSEAQTGFSYAPDSEFGTPGAINTEVQSISSGCNDVCEQDVDDTGVALTGSGVSTGRCLVGSMKVIVLVSDNLFFNESEFLDKFEAKLKANVGPGTRDRGLALYAEKFGYRRFTMSYDTDDPVQLRISQLLYEMEFAQTRQIVGPIPEAQFPGSK